MLSILLIECIQNHDFDDYSIIKTNKKGEINFKIKSISFKLDDRLNSLTS